MEDTEKAVRTSTKNSSGRDEKKPNIDGVFKDTTNLTKWTIRFLYLQVGVAVLSIITGQGTKS